MKTRGRLFVVIAVSVLGFPMILFLIGCDDECVEGNSYCDGTTVYTCFDTSMDGAGWGRGPRYVYKPSWHCTDYNGTCRELTEEKATCVYSDVPCSETPSSYCVGEDLLLKCNGFEYPNEARFCDEILYNWNGPTYCRNYNDGSGAYCSPINETCDTGTTTCGNIACDDRYIFKCVAGMWLPYDCRTMASPGGQDSSCVESSEPGAAYCS
jgi:hypothetical protein